MPTADCIFCRIADGSAPARKIYDDGVVMAFHDIAPRAPIHVLIAPKRHVSELVDTSDPILLGLLLRTPNEVAKATGAKGFRLVLNCGPHAFQTVNHLHIHFLGVPPDGSVMDLWPTRTSLLSLPDRAVTT